MNKKQEKIIKTVQKLLAMADDKSSPNEALIAANRARKLMDKYEISRSDLVQESEFDTSCSSIEGSEPPTWMQFIATAVGKYNDCNCQIMMTYFGEYSIAYMGFKADSIVSLHTFEYLVAATKRMCEGYNFATDGEVDAYRTSMANTISGRLQQMMYDRRDLRTGTGQSLVVVKKTAVEAHFGKPEYRVTEPELPTRDEVMAHSMGNLDGKTVGLDVQIESDDTKDLTDEELEALAWEK